MSDYRRGVRRCPACGQSMAERAFAQTMVDVCQGCFGVWVDWMDGPLEAVGHTVGKLPVGRRDSTAEALHCPDCGRELDEARFGPADATIYRCGSCAGSYVPRTALPLLDAPPPPEEPEGVLHRLLQQLGALLGS